MRITNRIVEAYLDCKYKAHLLFKGETGTPHDYEALVSELADKYRARATEALLRRCKLESAPRIPSVTLDDLKEDHPLILDSTVETGQFQFHFDALKRVEGPSPVGPFHYGPVMFHHDYSVRETEKMLVAFGAFVLGQGQGYTPEFGTLVVGEAMRLSTVQLCKRTQKIATHLDELRKIGDGVILPNVRLNRHCDVCRYRERCKAEAGDKDDLSLLRGMSDAEIEKLNGKGLFSIIQLSHTFRPRKPSKRARKTSDRRNFALQALALREKTTYVLNRPSLPKSNTSIFVDIEGDPDRKLHYLLGMLIRVGNEVHFHNYWVDGSNDAPTLFWEFVATIEQLDDLTIFHYGAYESRFFSRMLRQQNCSKRIARAIDESVNVLRELRNGVYFPTLSNGLKDVARYLGFQWTETDASGVMSLVWRRRWEMTGNAMFKQKLLRYNREDCLALALVTDALHAIQDGKSSLPTVRGSNEVAPVPDLVSDEGRHQFGAPNFFSTTFEEVNRCAYFDYQRERILLRTRGKRISAARRSGKRKKYRPRPNRREEVRSIKCPKCKSTRVTRNYTRRHTRYNLNLRLSKGGTRRWITKYTAAQHRCRDCGKKYMPPTLIVQRHLAPADCS